MQRDLYKSENKYSKYLRFKIDFRDLRCSTFRENL